MLFTSYKNLINIKIELPQEVLNRLESVIIETVTRTIKQEVDNIKAEPKMYTRKEAASTLRITYQLSVCMKFKGD